MSKIHAYFCSFPQIVPTIRDTTDNFDQMGIEKRKCNLERNYRITNCKLDRAIKESKASLVWYLTGLTGHEN